jgi:uncharacterized membrane protein
MGKVMGDVDFVDVVVVHKIISFHHSFKSPSFYFTEFKIFHIFKTSQMLTALATLTKWTPK